MVFRTIHTTRYRYEHAVSQSISEARLTPRTFARQRANETRIVVDPGFATLETRVGYFGNVVTTISVLGAHDRFSVTATSLVETGIAPPAELPAGPWEKIRDSVANPADAESLAASEFIYDSPYVPISSALAEYARPTFRSGRSLAESIRELMERVNTEFVYKPQSTSIEIPLIEVLEKRHGVCQDFAHVMIGALRSVGLPARYVSGYLRSGANVTGAEASHAWVSVWMPGAGWVDYDPTNNVLPYDGHVTIGWGRDFGDVTPLKGIALGGGSHTVDVEVKVTPVG